MTPQLDPSRQFRSRHALAPASCPKNPRNEESPYNEIFTAGPVMTLSRLLLLVFALTAPLLALQQGHGGEGDMGEQLKSLLRVTDPSTGFILVALGVSFLAGAAHALTPGHGKALVAAYLVGSGGTVRDAVFLGAVVTITHTAAVFVLGVVTIYATQHFLMETIYAWLSVASGLLIVGIGGWLLTSRWKIFRNPNAAHDHGHYHGPFGGHTHGHSHSHSHSEDEHSSGHAADGHTHDHDDAHEHDHSHEPGHTHDDTHSHGHSHAPAVGRKSLLSLGISGGLIPCPEALAVLLISFTLNRLLFGLIILLAFSLGLAAILIAIGVAMVLAGPALKKFSSEGPIMRALPVGSAAIVTLLGVAILYKAASDTGLINF